LKNYARISSANSDSGSLVHLGLAWLAIIELRREWLRSTVATLAIALAIVAVAVFFHQIELRRAELLAEYEQGGAANVVAELSGISKDEADALAEESRRLNSVRSVEAPYNGGALQLAADISFLVFGNERQQEYLGARTSVLGVDAAFDLGRDYYVNFHDLNPNAPSAVLGVPLLRTAGEVRPPTKGEVLAPSDVTDYVGVQPEANAIIELIYTGVEPAIRRTVEGHRLLGTFDAIGPDQGRFDPFWRLEVRGEEVLTVRRPDATESATTTTPIVLSAEVVGDFLTYVRSELGARGAAAPTSLARNQLVVRANSIKDVGEVSTALSALLRQHAFEEHCGAPAARSFCVQTPERNNFRAALQEEKKLASGGSFFITLLLLLVVIGIAGLEVQVIIMRWRDIGVLQAVGFSRSEVLRCLGYRLGFVLIGGVVFAMTACFVLPAGIAGSVAIVVLAGASSVAAAALAALPVLLWPLSRMPAELIRVAT
jgi:hypothetical protein